MKKSKKIIIAIVLLILFLCVGLFMYVGSQVSYGSTHLADTFGKEESTISLKNNFDTEENSIKSSKHDHKIPTYYINNNSNKTIILSHGLGGNKNTILDVGRIFNELGFNLISYDLRTFGENEATTNTYGILEKDDLLDVMDYYGKDNYILYGQSYGAMPTILNINDERISKVILDSPLTDGSEMIMNTLVKMDKDNAEFMFKAGSFYTKLTDGWSFEDIDLYYDLKNINKPILILYSENDKVINPEQVNRLKDFKNIKLYNTKGKHAEYYRENEEDFIKVIEDYLN